jgi:hypothetical protein
MTVLCAIMHEVVGPHVIGVGRFDWNRPSEVSFPRLLLGLRQSFFSPYTLNSLVVDHSAVTAQVRPRCPVAGSCIPLGNIV